MSNSDTCRKFLKQLSIAHAIPRIKESFILRGFNFKNPILDLGCGEGVFTKIFFGEEKVDVGLDINPEIAKLARKNGVYKKVVVAPASDIPFPDNYFKNVFSNSVLEHITDLDSVFSEVHRTLKKGGKFIFIVPDKSASDYLFYAEILEKIGFKSLAKAYINFKNKLYRYSHLESKNYWEEISKRNNFKVKRITGFFSPREVRIVDFFSLTAFPDYILRRIFKHSFIFRPDFAAKILTPFILKYCRAVKNSKNTAWCFELEK